MGVRDHRLKNLTGIILRSCSNSFYSITIAYLIVEHVLIESSTQGSKRCWPNNNAAKIQIIIYCTFLPKK